MASEGFDVHRSVINEDTLQAFVEDELKDDLQSVPGIGPAAAKVLSLGGVLSTHQLIGVYLSMYRPNTPLLQWQDAMWFWLKEKDIKAHRSGIVHALTLKLMVLFPGAFE